jgi:hypothetical protein
MSGDGSDAAASLTRPPAPRGAARTLLLEDGSLALTADRRVMDVVGAWLPLHSRPAPSRHRAAALIRARAGAPSFAVPEGAPTMDLYGVRAWVSPEDHHAVLADLHGRIGGRVEPGPLRATIHVDPAAPPPDPRDVFATFTIAAAMLLTRLGRALVHAGAVVAPGGGAWLLPASSFSGKSTTCATLIRGGWNYLGDDQVVLGEGPEGEVRAEGWPRPFHLDLGYTEGSSRGVRSRVDPGGLGPGRWQRSAPVAGLLFPRVEAELETTLLPLHPAAAFVLLLRQSPWILADGDGAAPVLALLERVAALPCYELRLGRDGYGDSARLQRAVEPALAAPAAASRHRAEADDGRPTSRQAG